MKVNKKTKIKKYVVDYQIDGDNLTIFNNLGESRKIKNTKKNMNKINHIIINSKIEIANVINEYEKNSQERLIVLSINCILLILSGMTIPLSFFTGFWLLFYFSILSFFICVLATSKSGLEYYSLVKNIQKLKIAIKKEEKYEFKIPNFILKTFKINN